jgi:hypothetical protein
MLLIKHVCCRLSTEEPGEFVVEVDQVLGNYLTLCRIRFQQLGLRKTSNNMTN